MSLLCPAVRELFTSERGHALCCPATLVLVPPALHARLQSLAGVPLQPDTALLLPDLASGSRLAGLATADPISLELKPKWGGLPDKRWVLPSVKLQRSRFQLLQQLRAAQVCAQPELPVTQHTPAQDLSLYAGSACQLPAKRI